MSIDTTRELKPLNVALLTVSDTRGATEDSSGTVVGGKYLLFGSVELEKSIYKNWSAALFYDTGKGVDDFSEALGQGVGAGVRYQLPFGQIRLDVASAVSEDGNPLRLHFTIGGDF
jgi:translocation and assembly module TamA